MRIMAPYSRNNQKRFYEILRYPDLLSSITADGKPKTREQIEELVEGLPPYLQKTAVRFGQTQFNRLQKLELLFDYCRDSFNKILTPLPEESQQAFQRLLDIPEVLALLTDYPDLSKAIADAYSEAPLSTLEKSGERSSELVSSRNEILIYWSILLQSQFDDLDLFLDCIRDYVKDIRHEWELKESDAETNDPFEIFRHQNPSEAKDESVYGQAYPFWFGYPYWDKGKNWRPRNNWLLWGFYLDIDNEIVLAGLPSYNFVDWFLNKDLNHFWYPEVTDLLLKHFESFGKNANGMNDAIGFWLEKVERNVPAALLVADTQRISRIRQYAEFRLTDQGKDLGRDDSRTIRISATGTQLNNNPDGHQISGVFSNNIPKLKVNSYNFYDAFRSHERYWRQTAPTTRFVSRYHFPHQRAFN